MTDIRTDPNRKTATTHDDHDATVAKPRVDVDTVYQHLETLRETAHSVDLTCAGACTEVPKDKVLYVGGISPDDVRQGRIADCTAQACIASIARSAAGRAYLRSMITETRTGYDVKLFQKTTHGYEPRTVRVDGHAFASRGFAVPTQGVDGPEEVWPRVLEHAILSLNGSKPTVNVPDSYGMLTGKTAVDSRPDADADFDAKILRDYGAGKMQILCTTGMFHGDDDHVMRGSVNLAEAHAYSVEKVEVRSIRHADGHYGLETLVTLRNPWGYTHPRPMTTDELKQYFSAYSVADMPSAP